MSKNNKDFFKSKNSWSEIKDDLLGCYLKPYFQKVLMTGHPICYVDCFAGQGRFDDGKDGSPLIALKIRNDCLKNTKRLGKEGAIKTCFIELTHGKALKNNIGMVNVLYDAPEIIMGKYEDNIDHYLSDKNGYNVFLYIDPYGIRALSSARFDRLKHYGFNTFEMLINFNSFGFFRDACRVMNVNYQEDKAFWGLDELIEYEPTDFKSDKESEKILTDIAGGDYWKGIVKKYRNKIINGYQAEQEVSLGYKKYLNKQFKYVLDMPIRLKPDQRPKYRMIHVSNHKEGCLLMAKNMLKRKNELFINFHQSGQISLFDLDGGFSTSAEGEVVTPGEVKEKALLLLKKSAKVINITEFLASFMNCYGLICDLKTIYDVLCDIEQQGAIDIIREPKFTSMGKASVFWEENKNQKVLLRRKS